MTMANRSAKFGIFWVGSLVLACGAGCLADRMLDLLPPFGHSRGSNSKDRASAKAILGQLDNRIRALVDEREAVRDEIIYTEMILRLLRSEAPADSEARCSVAERQHSLRDRIVRIDRRIGECEDLRARITAAIAISRARAYDDELPLDLVRSAELWLAGVEADRELGVVARPGAAERALTDPATWIEMALREEPSAWRNTAPGQ